MIFEKITITNRHVVVSYSGDDLSLTPAQEAALSEFWKGRIERLTRQVLGDFTFLYGTSSGNAAVPADVPAREHESPKGPFRGVMIPFGNIGGA